MLNFRNKLNKTKENNSVFLSQRTNILPKFIYFLLASLYFFWIIFTYRNIVHMDMLYIVSTKVKNLYENNLQINDFIYQPMFPCLISIVFTFLNSIYFHLNTVIETVLGCLFLILLGYKYFKEISASILNQKHKEIFALLIGFIVFGLHKWEASFTSFFSFAVFLNLCICFFNYFFLIKYINVNNEEKNDHSLLFFIFSNLLVILEAPAYFYSFIISLIVLLFLIRHFEVAQFNNRSWNKIFVASVMLLLCTLIITTYLSTNPSFKHYASNVSIFNFISSFFQNPFWISEFYLIANSGPFLGEAVNCLELRALFGLFIIFLYLIAIYYVIKSKDKRLLVPVGLILYNIISYGLITMGRYNFNALEYGASSRYTAFNLSGVLGLVTIIFFYILDAKKNINKKIALLSLSVIIAGYLYVDLRQINISQYRTASFNQMKKALLSGENLDILQADKTISLNAIEVLKKNNLNVYYEEANKLKNDSIDLTKINSFSLIVGTSNFEEIEKEGFHENENGIAWTNGSAYIFFDRLIQTPNSVTIELNTYLPPICSHITPQISLINNEGKNYQPTSTERDGDKFTFYFDFKQPSYIQEIKILSEVIDSTPDKRILSFPFKSLVIKN